MRKSYLRRLDVILESVILTEDEIVPQDVNQTQAAIADTGSDVNVPEMDAQDYQDQEVGAVAETSDQPSADQYPEEDLSYMQEPEDGRTNDVVNEISEDKKLLRLYDLFKNLLEYGKEFETSICSLDKNLIDGDQLSSFSEYVTRIKNGNEKIENYLEFTFSADKYEKALYLYILLRTELLANVKGLRRVLQLDEQK